MNAEINELPFEIQKLIAKVVKRTRLRKAECADIERELTAHFREGLASGKSVAQLVEAFGGAKVSAKCIRAGAIAKRSPLDRALRQMRIAVGWTFVVFLVLYGTSLGYLLKQHPVISFDPNEQYHAMLPKVAPQDRAWPIYKQGLIAIADPIEIASNDPNRWGQERLTYEGLGDGSADGFLNRDWAGLRPALRARQAGIDMLVKAASMPALGFVPSLGINAEDLDICTRDSMGQVTDPTHPLRWIIASRGYFLIEKTLIRANSILAADAMMAVEDGEGGRFVRDIDAMIGLSHHLEELNFEFMLGYGAQIRFGVFRYIIEALEWRPESLSDGQLKQLADILQKLPSRDFEIDLSFERLLMHDDIQRFYSDDGSGDGWFNPSYRDRQMLETRSRNERINSDNWYEWDPLTKPFFQMYQSTLPPIAAMLSPAEASLRPTRKQMTEHCDLMMRQTEEQSKRPLWEWTFDYEKQYLNGLYVSDGLAKQRWDLPRTLMPRLTALARTRRMWEFEYDAAQTAVALTCYRRAHGGQWPVTLDALVPDYLERPPIDPVTGQPVVYGVKDGRAFVCTSGNTDRIKIQDGQVVGSLWTREGEHWSSSQFWLWFLSDDKLERWKYPK